MTLTLPLITDWRCSTSFPRQMSRKRLLLFQSRLFFATKVFSNVLKHYPVLTLPTPPKCQKKKKVTNGTSSSLGFGPIPSLSPNHKKSSLFLEMPMTEDEHKHKSRGREFRRRKVPQPETIAHPPFLNTGTTSGRRRCEKHAGLFKFVFRGGAI